jgi:hypothetical protein
MISGRHVERIVLQNSLEKPSMLSVDKVPKFHKWLQNFIKINIKYGIFPAGNIFMYKFASKNTITGSLPVQMNWRESLSVPKREKEKALTNKAEFLPFF